VNLEDDLHVVEYYENPDSFGWSIKALFCARKRGLKPSAPLTPATKPDIDKLTRSTLDSLIGAVFDDDSRIVRLVVDKQYAVPGAEGARIRVQEWQP
jgi:Holliday junction resolvase RusA-like endonuclease